MLTTPINQAGDDMSIIRTFSISSKQDLERGIDCALTYTVEWVDYSFAHAFGIERQGCYEIDRWELTISKLVLGWKTVTLDGLEVPEALYDTLNALCEKHLNDNPIEE